jgi:ATP-dependent Clp protease ATP-binding subunit ClpA
MSPLGRSGAGYDLKRFLREQINNRIAREIIRGEIEYDSIVAFDRDTEGLEMIVKRS